MIRRVVLLVEDDEWLAASFVTTLVATGYDVVHVTSAQDALAAFDDSHISAVVLDMFLPGANGLQLLNEMQSYSDIASVPIIVCSTAASQLPRDVMEHYGVLTILDKTTLTPTILRDALKAVIR